MSEPEHIREILKRALNDLESKMTHDFGSKLSGEIDTAISLLDFFNPQAAPASMGDGPDLSPACTPSGGDDEQPSS